MNATVGCAPLDKISCTMRLLRLPHAGSQIYHLFFRQFQTSKIPDLTILFLLLILVLTHKKTVNKQSITDHFVNRF